MMAIFSYFCGPEFAVLDRVSFGLGEENDTVISDKLLESAHCLVVITQDFFQSKWTVEEVDYFLKARKENPDNKKKRKIIPLFIGFSPAQCRSLKRSDCEIDGQSLSEEEFQKRKRIAKELSRLSGREQHERFEASEEFERVKSFILNQIPDLLENHLREGSEPSLLPDLKPGLLLYIHKKAMSYYQEVNGEVNLTNFLRLMTKLRLQDSLRIHYADYDQLERLFDERKTPIVDSFINLALISEKEYKQKEESLKEGAFIDERIASHEALYLVQEPLALHQLFESKKDTEHPKKILILGRAGIGKSVLCQYLAVQWASESKDDEEEKGELGHYLRQKFNAVFWIKLREVADFLKPSTISFMEHMTADNVLSHVLHKFCLRGLNQDKPSPAEVEEYIELNNNRVLFILDGYDEITDSVARPDSLHLNSFLEAITTRQYVLITSRPLAMDALGKNKIKFDRKLENIGFTNENIEIYIRHFMREAEKLDQAELLLKFLRVHPSIWGIAHIPINLELLSWLWSQGDLTLEQGEIKTLSKLYQMIVNRVQDAYIRKSNPLHARPLNASLESKEEGLLFSDLVNEFLGYLAYEAMQHESLLIPKKPLQKALRDTLRKYRQPSSLSDQEILLKSATDKLGFLRATGQGGRSPLDQAHYFIHLSFQEFYAARYITRVLSGGVEDEKKTAIIHQIRTEKYTPRYQLMLWITAGLVYQQGVEEGRKFIALEQFWQAILSKPRDLIGFHHLVLVMHCLDECEADEDLPLHRLLIDQQGQWLKAYIKHGRSYQAPPSADNRYIKKYNEKETILLYLNQLILCPFVLQKLEYVIHCFLKNLKSKDAEIKEFAIEALGKLADPLQNSRETVITALVNVLKDRDTRHTAAKRYPQHTGGNVRLTVFNTLSRLKEPSAALMTVFLEALQDEHLRRNAIITLCRLPNPSEAVMAAIADILKNADDKYVKETAVEGLDKLQNPSPAVISGLLDILEDKSESSVRKKALEVLGKLPNLNEAAMISLVNTLKDGDQYVREKAVKALNHQLQGFRKARMARLTHALKYENRTVKRCAMEILQPSNPGEITALMTTLKEDPSVKKTTVEELELAYLQSPIKPVITALMNILIERDTYVTRSALEVLNQLSSPTQSLIVMLLDILKDKDALMKSKAIEVLGRLQTPEASVIMALVDTLKDKSPLVRSNAIEVLGRLQTPEASVILALIETLKDEDESVKCTAIKALRCQLKKSSEATMAVLVNSLKGETSYVSEEIASTDGSLMVALASILKDEPDAGIRYHTVAVFDGVQSFNETVMVTLLNALKDKSSLVRSEAIGQLGRLRHPSAVIIGAFFDALRDKEQSVRYSAITVLNRWFPPTLEEAMAVLFNDLKNEDKYVRQKAVEALGYLQHPNEAVITALLTALKDEDEYVARTAVKVLGDCQLQNPHKTIMTALFSVLKDKGRDRDKYGRDKRESVRRSAVAALGRLPDPGEVIITAFLEALKDESESMREAAVRALCQLENPSEVVMIAIIYALLRDSYRVDREVLSMLKQHKNLNEVMTNEVVMAMFVYALKIPSLEFDLMEALSYRLQNSHNAVIHVLLDVLEKNNDVVGMGELVDELNNPLMHILSHLKTDQISVVFERLIYHPLLLVYLLSYFRENHLLSIDHEKGQLILFLYNQTHKIFLSREILVHLEKQVIRVTEQLQYPLDLILIDEKEICLSSKAFMGVPQYPLSAYEELEDSKSSEDELDFENLYENNPMQFTSGFKIISEGENGTVCSVAQIGNSDYDISIMESIGRTMFSRLTTAQRTLFNPLLSTHAGLANEATFSTSSATPKEVGDSKESVNEFEIQNLREDSQNHLTLAIYYYQKNDVDKTIKHYIKSIQGQKNPLSAEQKNYAYHNLACCYHVKGQLDEAEQHFLQALEQKPETNTYSEYGLLLMHQSRFLEAITLLEKALARKEDGSSLYYGLMEKKLLDDYLQTEITEEQGMNIKPVLIAYYCLVRCYQSLGQRDQMQDSLARFTEWVEQKRSPLSYRLLLYTHQYLGNPEKIAIYKQILEGLAEPDSSAKKPEIAEAVMSEERSLEEEKQISPLPVSKEAVPAVTLLSSPSPLADKGTRGDQKEEASIREGAELTSLKHREARDPHVEEISRRELPTSPSKLFSNESDQQILQRLQAILENFDNGEIEEDAMRHGIGAALESFKNRGPGYSLNSSRMFRMIIKLLQPEKIALKASEDIVQRIILGDIPETEKEKIRRRVVDSEFYQVLFEGIADGLGIKFFLSESQHFPLSSPFSPVDLKSRGAPLVAHEIMPYPQADEKWKKHVDSHRCPLRFFHFREVINLTTVNQVYHRLVNKELAAAGLLLDSMAKKLTSTNL
jgi:HEAT repeat protein/tetratricopeptide (TPR) repeat protein